MMIKIKTEEEPNLINTSNFAKYNKDNYKVKDVKYQPMSERRMPMKDGRNQ